MKTVTHSDMDHPTSITIGKNRNIYVGTQSNGILVFSSDWVYLRTFSSESKNLQALSIDKGFNILVADCENHLIRRFSPSDEIVRQFRRRLAEPLGFFFFFFFSSF